jgi:hypothetical protein
LAAAANNTMAVPRERQGPVGAYAIIALEISMPARTGIDLKPTNRGLDQQAKPLCRFRSIT